MITKNKNNYKLFIFRSYKEKGYGLDDLLPLLKKKKEPVSVPLPSETAVNLRREVLKDLAALPVLGLFGWGAYRSGQKYSSDTMSGATIQLNRVTLGELKGELPKGKLGNHEVSRLVLGAGTISGFVHARDLIYVGSLSRSYNNEKKSFETLILCEQAGINCVVGSSGILSLFAKYKKLTGSKLKVIAPMGVNGKSADIYDTVTTAIDNGCEIIQVHGGLCDQAVSDRKLELIDGMLNRIRSNGLVAGLGAHTIDSLIICEENGIIPDYYMKTMHHDNYWSAHPRENRIPFEVIGQASGDHNMWYDNMFDAFPDRTVEFVNRVKVPVMGFKTLAAGAIHPKSGFKWAFENGADFIAVGMFDFQVVDDVNICIDTLQNLQNRKREWYS